MVFQDNKIQLNRHVKTEREEQGQGQEGQEIVEQGAAGVHQGGGQAD
jgi:hypothetical protein